MIKDVPAERPLVWLGRSKDDISAMPKAVKASFGYRLRRVQQGQQTADTKALSQFGAGVFELREAFGGNAWRVVYAVKLRNAVYVLHAFMKKSTSGKALARRDVDTIVARLKQAHKMDEENDED